MFEGQSLLDDWERSKGYALLVEKTCAVLPLRGDWEPDDRIALAMASFRLAQEHHRGMRFLIEQSLFASAYALMRPQTEASFRTFWILDRATDAEIQKAFRGRDSVFPLLGDLNECIDESRSPILSGPHRGLLDSLNHGCGKAMGAQFLDDDARTKANSAFMVQSAMTLSGAGHRIASLLGWADVVQLLERMFPNFP